MSKYKDLFVFMCLLGTLILLFGQSILGMLVNSALFFWVVSEIVQFFGMVLWVIIYLQFFTANQKEIVIIVLLFCLWAIIQLKKESDGK